MARRENVCVTRRLLSLALTVDLLDSDDYAWRILESPDHLAEFESLVEGALTYATYSDALRAGREAMMELCEDPLVGPMTEEEDEDLDDEQLWTSRSRR